jgi:hypothetical protein
VVERGGGGARPRSVDCDGEGVLLLLLQIGPPHDATRPRIWIALLRGAPRPQPLKGRGTYVPREGSEGGGRALLPGTRHVSGRALPCPGACLLLRPAPG